MDKQLIFLHFIVQPVMGTNDGSGGFPPLPPDEQPTPAMLSVAGLENLSQTWPAKLDVLRAQYDARQFLPEPENNETGDSNDITTQQEE